jgi:hypothetical protein
VQNKVTEFDLTLVLGVNHFADDMCGFLAIVVKLQFYSDNVLPKEASATLTYYHTRGWWGDSACTTSVTWVAVSVERYYRCVLRKMHQPYGLLLRMMQLDGRNREVRAEAMRSIDSTTQRGSRKLVTRVFSRGVMEKDGTSNVASPRLHWRVSEQIMDTGRN